MVLRLALPRALGTGRPASSGHAAVVAVRAAVRTSLTSRVVAVRVHGAVLHHSLRRVFSPVATYAAIAKAAAPRGGTARVGSTLASRRGVASPSGSRSTHGISIGGCVVCALDLRAPIAALDETVSGKYVRRIDTFRHKCGRSRLQRYTTFYN